MLLDSRAAEEEDGNTLDQSLSENEHVFLETLRRLEDRNDVQVVALPTPIPITGAGYASPPARILGSIQAILHEHGGEGSVRLFPADWTLPPVRRVADNLALDTRIPLYTLYFSRTVRPLSLIWPLLTAF